MMKQMYKRWEKRYKRDRHEALVDFLFYNPFLLFDDVRSVYKEPTFYDEKGKIKVCLDLELHTEYDKILIEVKSSNNKNRMCKGYRQIKTAEKYNDDDYLFFLVYPVNNKNFKNALNSLVVRYVGKGNIEEYRICKKYIEAGL